MKNKAIYFITLITLFTISGTSRAANNENIQIAGIKFTGNHTFSSGVLKKYMQLNSGHFFPTVILRKDRPIFYASILENDINHLLRFYTSEGFADAKISIIKTIERNKNQIHLTFVIEENQPILISQIDININDVDSLAVSAVKQKLHSKLHLKPQQRFRDELLVRDKELILDYYMQNGYPYVTLDTGLEVQENRVTVKFNIKTGPLCTFGPTQIQENIITPIKKIENQLAYRQTEQFKENLLQKTQKQLYALGSFQYVSVNALYDTLKTPIIPIEIKLKESPRFRIKTGFGYGREDQFRLSAEVLKIGFPDKVKRLGLVARHSYLEPYNVSLKWVHPAFPTANASLTIEPFFKKEREPAYRIRRYGSNASFQQNISDYTSAYFNYTYERDQLYLSKESQVEALQKKDLSLYNKSSFTLGWSRNTALPILTPEKGFYSAATVTLSGFGFKSDFHFFRFLLENRHYQKLDDNLVIATRFKIGMIEPLRSDQVTPLEERYYAGGSSSIRGWARSAIGPVNKVREPIGGNSYIEASLECRYPLWRKLSGVAFIDCGNVWAAEYYYNITNLRYALGAGLRFSTPIGPVRFDVATPVFEAKQRVQFHLSAGHAF
ncbi:MAG TPA: BamA/TamA family outer membrane protein [bacterium]|nr:BamA/TamA family outer membrane protein [bacterium]HPN46282.1 BamA/TamA family outer membrane protein [bacterium]